MQRPPERRLVRPGVPASQGALDGFSPGCAFSPWADAPEETAPDDGAPGEQPPMDDASHEQTPDWEAAGLHLMDGGEGAEQEQAEDEALAEV